MLCKQVATYKISCFASFFLPSLLKNFTMEEVNSIMFLRVIFIGSSKFTSLIWSSLKSKKGTYHLLVSNLYLTIILIFLHLFPRHHPGHGTKMWQVTYDLLLLLETSKVYSGFLNDGVLLLNVGFSQLQVRMANALSGTSKRVCLSTIHVLFSSFHTQFLLYLSQIAQLCIYISKCPCPCYWPCGFCGRTYKISCKSQICV